jgi:hypothetical protein
MPYCWLVVWGGGVVGDESMRGKELSLVRNDGGGKCLGTAQSFNSSNYLHRSKQWTLFADVIEEY